MTGASESLTTPEPLFLLSNMSLPWGVMMLGSLTMYERYMTKTSANGIELTPLRPMVSRFMHRLVHRANMLAGIETPGNQLRLGEVVPGPLEHDSPRDRTPEDEAYTKLVQTQHMSFRQDSGDNGPYAQAFPRRTEGLGLMARIQGIIGNRPAVMYPPNEDEEYDSLNAPFSERSFQPNPNDFQRMGLREGDLITDIEAQMTARGLTSITYDIFHAQGFKRPTQLARALAHAGLVRSIHLSLNRTEHDPLARSKAAQNSRQARHAFATSANPARHTPEGKIIQIIAKEWQVNPKYKGVQTYVVLEDGPLGVRTARDQAAIIENARTIIADPYDYY